VGNPFDYQWSSINEYFSQTKSAKTVDAEFVDGLFGDRGNLMSILEEWISREAKPTTTTRLGEVYGSKSFIADAIKRFDRRHGRGKSLRMRKKEAEFTDPEKIVDEFQKIHSIRLKDIDFSTREEKTLRSVLLKKLKEEGGLTYREIIQYEPFCRLKFSTLPKMYKRIKEKSEKVP
jgi:hypothetical protein